MDSIQVSALVLLSLNVFQFIFWSRQTHRLIDKLMSRNYAEYQASNVVLPQSSNKEMLSQDLSDPVLDDLNRQFTGMQ